MAANFSIGVTLLHKLCKSYGLVIYVYFVGIVHALIRFGCKRAFVSAKACLYGVAAESLLSKGIYLNHNIRVLIAVSVNEKFAFFKLAPILLVQTS